MKRIVVFIVMLVALFCGCESAADISNRFTLPIKITAVADGSNAEFTAVIKENESRVTFGDGHTLSGTVLRFSDNGNTAEIGATLKREIKSGVFPAQEALINLSKRLAKNDKKGVVSKNTVIYTIDETEIMVYYDKNSDSITRIETEEGERHFGFTVVSLEPYEEQSNGDYTP